MGIKFLDIELVLFFHRSLINEYGGAHGLRDEALLESALAQATMTIDGKFLHEDVFDMAAAYGFHICNNHAFIDGNKRLALVAIDIFLQMNGWELIANEKDTYKTIMQLASGELTKQELRAWIRRNAEPIIS